MDDIKRRFEERYRSGNTPWDTGRADFNLVETLNAFDIRGEKALEIGCGTGDNAIYLFERGFDVTATEIVEMAFDSACQKARTRDAKCRFLLHDILETDVSGAPFDLVFDRGCFHAFDTGEMRGKFAEAVSRHLKPHGYWLSLIGNADEKRNGPGPPQRSASDIVLAVEPLFEILMLKSSHFDSDMEPPPRNWVMLARRRYS